MNFQAKAITSETNMNIILTKTPNCGKIKVVFYDLAVKRLSIVNNNEGFQTCNNMSRANSKSPFRGEFTAVSALKQVPQKDVCEVLGKFRKSVVNYD